MQSAAYIGLRAAYHAHSEKPSPIFLTPRRLFAKGTLMEKRATTRKKAGTIEFGDDAINCVVRNMTELGAILHVTSPIGIPDHFTLALRTDGRRKYCRTVWWNEKRIGVAFE
jgi:hypothetical protein